MKNHMMMSTKRVKARGKVDVDNPDDETCDVAAHEDVTNQRTPEMTRSMKITAQDDAEDPGPVPPSQHCL